ncbi:MAG: hypothetical protein JXR10_17570 [Cyclobacteriaceae bacterium]
MFPKFLLFSIILTSTISLHSQGFDGVFMDKWHLPKNQEITLSEKVSEQVKLDSGWSITGIKGSITYQYSLSKDSVYSIKKDTAVVPKFSIRISEVKHENEKSDKLYFNTYSLKNSAATFYEGKGYIKVPENGYVKLIRSNVKLGAITIPLTVRPALNDTIGRAVSNDLKIGASISYNINMEFFKNRRIQAKKSVYGLSAGLGLGFSKITLDSLSTSLSSTVYDKSQDGVAVSLLPGLGVNFKGFQILAFYGIDFAITSNVKDWNYHQEPYYGFGIGFDISTFAKIL